MSRYYYDDDEDEYSYSYRQMSNYEIAEKAGRISDKHPDYEPVEVSASQGICTSWWGKSWCRNLERYADWRNRIERGKKYVRGGAVIDLKINGGNINARVVGSRATPYRVTINIKPLSKERQSEVEKLASGKIQNLEALMAGNFPEELKDALFDEGILFPEPDEINFECNCPDSAYMCKHIAAVLYGIGVRLDTEPLYLFQMRGVNVEKFISNVIGNKIEKMLAKVEEIDSSRILQESELMEVFGVDTSDLPEISDDPEPESETETESENENIFEEDRYEDDEDNYSEAKKSKLNLPKFLKQVDDALSKVSHENLKNFVHEVARTCPEDLRINFLALLTEENKSVQTKEDSINALNRIKKAFTEINNGTRCLESEEDPERYDYYDEDDYDDYEFTDPDDLLPEIEFALRFISKCVYSDNYEVGYEVVNLLSDLVIHVDGAFEEYHDNEMTFSDLYDYGILEDSFDDFMNEAIFLTYMINKLSDRPEKIYSIIKQFYYDEMRLENVMQVGNKDLPDIDEFIFLWADYLGELNNVPYNINVKALLLDACTTLKDEEQKLQLASKFAKRYSELYLSLLQEHTNNNKERLQIGLQALKEIPVSNYARSDIALLTAEYALKYQDKDSAELCWFEAFKSNVTFVNYMRLKFNAKDWSKYASEVIKICKRTMSEKKNIIHGNNQKSYYGILFFECDFDSVFALMNVKTPLMWTPTFMKEGLALFLLLLFEGDKLREGLRTMLNGLVLELKFTTGSYIVSTGLRDKQLSEDLFWDLFKTWKKDIKIDNETCEEWLKWLEGRIDFRTVGLLEAKRYNRYNECASFIAAYGEVQESRGNEGFKSKMMMKYKNKYPTRKAFHRELDSYRG